MIIKDRKHRLQKAASLMEVAKHAYNPKSDISEEEFKDIIAYISLYPNRKLKQKKWIIDYLEDNVLLCKGLMKQSSQILLDNIEKN